ncbi:MAG: putative rane-associated protein [Myxococcaceae bacterium]|jgi:membrane protein DedA with SNARE-associated domain|nr:putative rane-associated protein [Myxococcaceae bacterium]
MVKAIFTVLGGFCVYIMGTLSYFGIALLMGIESACIPLPSELIMPYAGAMSSPEVNKALAEQFHIALPQFNIWIAAFAGAIGCNLGSEVAYWVGATGGRKAIERYGKYVLMSKHELAIADRWFDKRGDIIILIARLLPVVRTFIAFPAGVARMNRTKFHVYTFVGSFPWCLGLAYVGQELGLRLLDEHSPLKQFMHKFDAVIAGVIVVAAVLFIRSRLKALKGYRDADKAAAESAK